MAASARNPMLEQLRMAKLANPLQGFRKCRPDDNRCPPVRSSALPPTNWPDDAKYPAYKGRVASEAMVSHCMEGKGYTKER